MKTLSNIFEKKSISIFLTLKLLCLGNKMVPGRFNNKGRGGRQKPPRYSNTQVQQPLSQGMSQSQASQVCTF